MKLAVLFITAIIIGALIYFVVVMTTRRTQILSPVPQSWEEVHSIP